MNTLDKLKEEIEYVYNRLKNNKKLNFDEITLENVRFILGLHENFLFQMDNDPEIIGYSGDDEINYITERTQFEWNLIEWILWYRECFSMKNNMFFFDHEECIKCGSNYLRKKEWHDEIMSDKIVCLDCGTEMVDTCDGLKLLQDIEV